MNVIEKRIPCYCGGELVFWFQKKKVNKSGEYKKPRWQLVNCFPLNKKAEGSDE
jgi:hypothetical protein